MSFRQDKLILLLDTGSNPQVRRTAGKQIADLAGKTFRASIEPKAETKSETAVKTEDSNEDVKPDISAETSSAEQSEKVTLGGAVSEEDAWPEVLDTVAKILPLLKAKGSDTRHAAAHTLGLLAGTLPGWTLPAAPFQARSPIHLPTLLRDEAPLLASAGREYAAKPIGGDKAKRRKAMMGSLGLGDAVGWGDDVDKVIGDEDDDVDMGPAKANGQPAPPSEPTKPPKDVFEGLSARQVAMLKRKKGNIEEEANKMRKLNAAATGAPGVSPSPSATPTPAPSPAKLEQANSSENVVTIDPGAKARAAAAASGGAIEPTDSPAPVLPKITIHEGQSPWQAVLLEVVPNLSAAEWQSRHGANLALLEVVRSTSFADDFLLHIARSLMALLALDRFGDFVGDTVIAPVRETAAQALGVVLKQLSLDGAREVHAGLMELVLQSWAKRGREADGLPKYEKFAWEIRHAGLLGLKYEVAVRTDLLEALVVGEAKLDVEEKPDVKASGATFLQDVVNAAALAMKDQDDDVRTVAATALLPITSQLASQLSHDELSSILDTLWDCLAEGGDELGSSTGAIMDLLGALIAHPEVMRIMAENSRTSGPRSRLALISRIYPFIRHPILTVRLSVAKALHTFATVPSLPRADWILEPFFQLLFQNLVLEQHAEIRRLSYATFEAALQDSADCGTINDVVSPNVEEWYKMFMTPVGSPLDASLFYRAAKTGSYNVDKPMMEGDLGLVSTNAMLETRLVAAKALALLRRYTLDTSDVSLLKKYLASGTAHQVFAAAVVIQEWSFDVDARTSQSSPLPSSDNNAKEFADILVKKIESPPPATYSEMTLILGRIATECQALLSAFNIEAKVSKDRIPGIPKRVDPLSTSAEVFSLASAQNVVGQTFDALSRLLTKNAIKTVLPSLEDRRRKVIGSIGYFSVMKERYDIQVDASIAGALIALRTMPSKFGPVIKAVMESVKREENVVLQERSAELVSAFVEFCGGPHFVGKVNPCPKVIKNLWTFLCSDTAVTPVFSPTQVEDGIISLREEKEAGATKPSKKGQEVPTETEEQISRRITRMGALAAFKAMAWRFEGRLFESVPAFWDGISAALAASYPPGTTDADSVWAENATGGQDMVDCLTSLRLVAPEVHVSLHPRLAGLLPQVVLALQSSYSVTRFTAAKCLATLCDVILDEGMKFVVDEVVPLIGDAKRVSARQGATEAIYHIIKLLDIKALPYVLFLIVPILGRMSDPDDQVRLLSTSTFASLVKMVPLEAGIPDPPGFSAELLARRDEERKFLMQLLDGSKAEQYQVPIPIKADLRQYQRDGVSWLAFLAKYQLHGILCDDMGLGKSLQSICIIGSKHFERAEKHRLSSSVDSAHLPSLIVCPPTLTGHWYYEILKFTDYLRPIQYVGSALERAALRPRLASHDVVIASYETIRADIAELSKIDWLYCVLDEGHIIKNAKTKLSAAVKQLRAQHRLLLSGTPIQNNVLELWSLFDFLMPGFLGNERAFNDKFSKPILADRDGKATPKEREIAAAALEALHKQVLPFLLRRLKEDVLHDLPPKIIQDYYCELSSVQKLLYDEFSKSRAAEEAGEEVSAEANGAGQGHVFQSLQYLRKLCNHPALVLAGEESRFEEMRRKIGGDAGGVHDIRHSPKLLALQQLLLDCGIGLPAAEKVGAGGEEYNQHRVLIFCQLRPMLDLIETDLFKASMPTVSYMRMDGSTDPRKRHAVVQTFNNDPRIDVLLLTTSVGGLGLNLTGADTVIFVDHDWNPMKDLQAMDRAHRLGQKKVVNVYRLITRGTLEEKIMGLQRFKLNIASSVVTQQNAGLGSMNTGEVLDLFKVSAEGEAPKVSKAVSGPASASKILEGLEDLPPEDEYAELSLSNFMSKV